eukprot:SAG22_NODE_11175_length_497_cov_0.778894_2_plen_109_part_01
MAPVGRSPAAVHGEGASAMRRRKGQDKWIFKGGPRDTYWTAEEGLSVPPGVGAHFHAEAAVKMESGNFDVRVRKRSGVVELLQEQNVKLRVQAFSMVTRSAGDGGDGGG